MNVFTNDFIMNVFIKLIWEWSYTFDDDPLASRCTFTSYAAAIFPNSTFTLAAAPFGFDVYVHFLCSSKIRAILRFLSSSTLSVPGEFTLTMQQQLHLHIHYKAAAATFNRHLQFGSSKISSSRKSIMIFFYLYISPYIITHFLRLINRFFCLTEKIRGNFLLTKAFGHGRSLIRVCGSNSTYTSIIKQQQVHRISIFLAAATKLIDYFFFYIYPLIL